MRKVSRREKFPDTPKTIIKLYKKIHQLASPLSILNINNQQGYTCSTCWGPACSPTASAQGTSSWFFLCQQQCLQFPRRFPTLDIELLVLVIVGIVWEPSWHGCEVDGYMDNQATQHLLNHGRSSSELHKLNLARELWWQKSQYDFKWNSLSTSTSRTMF